ncbi:MAG: tetratricopeptide repeat protein [Bacteroidia bacterium]|jgi:adenylate cyclase|nr:tetratricopeptide repeat protein [Bacteroidia bacterium]
MKRALTIFSVVMLQASLLFAQSTMDSLQRLLKKADEDTNKVNILLELSKANFSDAPDQAIKYAEESKALSLRLNWQKGVALSLKNIGRSYYTKGDYVQTLDYWNQSIAVFDSIGDKAGVANLLSNLGAVFFNQGDDASALDYYLKSLKQAEEIEDTLRIVTTCINIGAVYFNKKATHSKAKEFYLRALPLSEKINDLDAIGTVTVNLGEIYLENNSLDTALFYFEKSLKAYEGSENLPYTLINIGKVYRKQAQYDKAIDFQQRAYDYAKGLDSKNDMALALIALAETYAEKGEYKVALEKFHEAEVISKEIGADYQLKDAYQGLSSAYARIKDYNNAYRYQALLLNIKDTLYNLDIEKKLGTLQFSFEIDKKESKISLLTKDKEIQEQEIKRQKLVRNSFIGGFAIVLLFAAVFLKQKNRISKEKKRSEELLLNILPEETAEELKATGTAKAKSFDMVSVMFTDFKNFTQASELLSAEELVAEINLCYSEFDKIVTRYGLEKIKTIGDSYMCAGGLPVTNTTHPVDIIKAGLEMQQWIQDHKVYRTERNLPFFELRLGIHTGPVVAGIVGIKKFAYDIWGDTVNTASRMESSGAIGKVNISGTTYDIVKDHFECTHRGKIEAKNKGQIDMYFVERAV